MTDLSWYFRKINCIFTLHKICLQLFTHDTSWHNPDILRLDFTFSSALLGQRHAQCCFRVDYVLSKKLIMNIEIFSESHRSGIDLRRKAPQNIFRALPVFGVCKKYGPSCVYYLYF